MKLIFFGIFFVTATFGLLSLGRKEDMNGSRNSPVGHIETVDPCLENTMKITGRIQIYSNEPHTFAGIIDENGTEYAVYPPSAGDELRTLQGHLIEFSVILLDEPRGYGSLFLKGGTVTPVKWEIIR